MIAFSNEARGRNTELPAEGSGLTVIGSFPRTPKCYGWTSFNTDMLFNLEQGTRTRVLPLEGIRMENNFDRMFYPSSN